MTNKDIFDLPVVPTFSVIIPFRNASGTIAQALDSLSAQSFSDWEALLIDDASEDDGPSQVQRLASTDPRIRLILESGLPRARGAAATRNIGLSAARGRFIAFLDADDQWLENKLEVQNAAFSHGADIVFSSYERFDDAGHSLGVIRARPLVKWADALAGNPIACLTAAYRRDRFPNFRMPQIGIHEDYAFWLSLLRESNVSAIGLPQTLARYRVHSGSVSANKINAALAVWQILGTQNLTFARRLVSFSIYAARSVWRRI